jgi:plastocyanin domain-containing protein
MNRNLRFASVITLLVVFGAMVSSSRLMAQQADYQVAVTEKGFEPSSITVRSNVPAKITFTRKTDATCATEVVVPEYNIKRALPLNQPVTVEFTPKKAGEIAFACGMNMLKGKVVVQQQ